MSRKSSNRRTGWPMPNFMLQSSHPQCPQYGSAGAGLREAYRKKSHGNKNLWR
jgi:hypothetical protein